MLCKINVSDLTVARIVFQVFFPLEHTAKSMLKNLEISMLG